MNRDTPAVPVSQLIVWETLEGNPMLNYITALFVAKKADMDERGASAVEYGLLIAGIAALIVAIVFIFGGVLSNIFQDTCNTIGASSGNSC